MARACLGAWHAADMHRYWHAVEQVTQLARSEMLPCMLGRGCCSQSSSSVSGEPLPPQSYHDRLTRSPFPRDPRFQKMRSCGNAATLQLPASPSLSLSLRRDPRQARGGSKHKSRRCPGKGTGCLWGSYSYSKTSGPSRKCTKFPRSYKTA